MNPLPIARFLFLASFLFLFAALHFLMIGNKFWGYGLIFPAFSWMSGALYLFNTYGNGTKKSN
jgi:hypothetical protein